MEAAFWHDRWEKNLIGFHRDEVNPYLKEYWAHLNLAKGKRVFVPLSGKSKDLIWLADQGYEVIGIELNHLAVEAFFAENNLTATSTQKDGFELVESGKICLICGDFFALTTEILGQIDAVYDRASLIALPPEMRQSYASKMTELCPLAPKLLITLEYDQAKMDGPPFAVTENEVRALYASNYEVSQCLAQDVLLDNERFRAKGLDYMNECVYQLTPIS